MRSFVTIALALVARVSYAEPAPTSPPPENYPSSYAARPLALPSGAIEGTAQVRWYRDANDLIYPDVYDAELLDLRARGELSRAELFAAASIFIHNEAESPSGYIFGGNRLSSFSSGARIAITPDLQLGADVTSTAASIQTTRPTPNPPSEHDFIYRAVAATRLHLARTAALDLTLSASDGPVPEQAATALPPFHYQSLPSFVVGAEARVIAQPHRLWLLKRGSRSFARGRTILTRY
jgi:hypothetical protein